MASDGPEKGRDLETQQPGTSSTPPPGLYQGFMCEIKVWHPDPKKKLEATVARGIIHSLEVQNEIMDTHEDPIFRTWRPTGRMFITLERVIDDTHGK